MTQSILSHHPFDPLAPAGFTHSIRAAQIREATLTVCRAKQWIDVARSAEEYAQAQRTYARATTSLCRLNLETLRGDIYAI